MKKIILSIVTGLIFISVSGQNVQNIRGVVRDNDSGECLPHSTVTLLNTTPVIGTIADSTGYFVLNRIPVGRYDIQVNYVGYEPVLVKEILLTSSKEVMLEIFLKENSHSLNEITVVPRINKAQPLNTMVIAGGRVLSVEEAKRYAGGFDDPARLASSFAGISSNMGDNGIVVRGNAPKFLQWRVEDVEIPNPNHFAEMTSFGGGGLTSLSSQVLGNSDFLTGAFPAEYSNALSGVFDMNLRNGNNREHEHTVQVGLIGIDVASEGPFKKGNNASYIFNYRYSTLSLLSPLMPEDADGTRYQDFSFKLYFPTKKAGIFSVWGTGLADRSGAIAEQDKNQREYQQDKENQDIKQYMGVVGINHKISAGQDAFLRTTLAATVNGLNMHTEELDEALNLLPQHVIKNTNLTFVLSSAYNKKFNARHTNKTGFRITGLKYDMLFKNKGSAGQALQTITDESGFSALATAYTNSSLSLSEQWTVNAGLNAQWFMLNNHYTIEPRIGVKWRFHPKHSFGLAYGLHSRLEMLNYYFTRFPSGELINQNLDFTRSHHLIFSYDWNLGNDFHLKVEPYIQKLYNVPVIPDSTFSFINLKGSSDWFITDKLSNQGAGLNYGLDMTFEKYISQGYYFMFTGSLFDSRYKTTGNKWYNTRYNRNYIFNFLLGKEWMIGSYRQHVFSANGRLTYQGGERYSPLNKPVSVLKQDVVYNESNPYSCQLPSAFLGHFTVSYTINKHHLSHEFAIKVLNITGYKDFYGHRYNFKTEMVVEERESIIIPNVSYKIEF
jgi:hypothetical protein